MEVFLFGTQDVLVEVQLKYLQYVIALGYIIILVTVCIICFILHNV